MKSHLILALLTLCFSLETFAVPRSRSTPKYQTLPAPTRAAIEKELGAFLNQLNQVSLISMQELFRLAKKTVTPKDALNEVELNNDQSWVKILERHEDKAPEGVSLNNRGSLSLSEFMGILGAGLELQSAIERKATFNVAEYRNLLNRQLIIQDLGNEPETGNTVNLTIDSMGFPYCIPTIEVVERPKLTVSISESCD